MKIKICGLRRMEDVLAVNAVRPDYIGFVFARSKRQISEEKAAELSQKLLPEIARVGVFVEAKEEQIVRLVRAGVIDLVQLHGQEAPETVKHLKEQIHKPIIKAIRMDVLETQPGKMAEAYLERYVEAGVDYFLFDNGAGGTGECFSWSRLPKVSIPYFLAGGISAANAKEAVRTVIGAADQGRGCCIALDASSHVETDGYKDAGKIKELVELVHQL